jgi:hypothetical protein
MKPEIIKYDVPETDKAYVAGIFDGEGCITVSRVTDNSRVYRAQIRVAMTDEDTILWLQSVFGGCKSRTQRNVLPNTKPMHIWALHNSRMIVAFLEAILPYLRLKRRRAELTISLAKMTRLRYSRGMSKPLSLQEIGERNDLALQISDDIRKGSNRGRPLRMVQ